MGARKIKMEYKTIEEFAWQGKKIELILAKNFFTKNEAKMMTLEPAIFEKINHWLRGNYDDDTKKVIQSLLAKNDITALTDAFYQDLDFGTGGLRGIMGVGSNRVNKYTIGAATQGFSNYLLKIYPNQEIKVVIAYDSRNDSDTLAKITAEVFAANGIYVYFFKGMRPTPMLSFAIRALGCHAGVMLTASHNPKEYNGYKAYGADGGQLVAPHDEHVMAEVRSIQDVKDIKFTGGSHNIELVGEAIDEQYLNELVKLSISKEAIEHQKNLKIVFSPIHGTGSVLVLPALRRFGFENIILVEEQNTPNGNFPTVVYPNPEEAEAMALSLKKAKEVDADLVMATDPDGDRVGVGIKNDKGEFILLNGNQVACLLIHYMLTAWEKSGKLIGKEYVVKTIVTSYLIDKIAAAKNVECFNTLTGFKYIGEIMTKLEGERTFIAGGEESYGYLVGEHARDKDAVIACAMIAEMVAYHKDQGSSLYDALLNLYVEYGYYQEKLISLKREGKKGAEEIKEMMKNLRVHPPRTLAGSSVVMIKDYANQMSYDLANTKTTTMDLPASDVIQLFTADGSIISARPSGTEPKVKFYCSVNTPLHRKEDYAMAQEQLNEKLSAILKDLGVA